MMEFFTTIILCGAIVVADCNSLTAERTIEVPGVSHSFGECFARGMEVAATPAVPPGPFKIVCGPHYVKIGKEA